MNSAAPRAFTLLELLVSVVLTLALAAMMLMVTAGTLSFWRRAQDGFTTGAQAKLALDFLERDFQSTQFRPDGSTTWLAVTVGNTPASVAGRGWQIVERMKPASDESLRLAPGAGGDSAATIAEARFGLTGAWVRMIASNVESTGTLPIAVSYQLVRRPVSGANLTTSNPAEVRYTLFRSAVSASETLATGNDLLSGYGGNQEASPPVRTAASLTNPSTASDALLGNVVDFGVWLYVRAPDGSLRRVFPADASDLAHFGREGEGAADATRFPQVADILIRVLSHEGARQIAALEQGVIARPANHANNAAWWWAVVEEYSQVYVRRVELRGDGR